MIDIQWRGKIGYGDIVSPICYAHNLSYKLKTKVDLTFRWPHDIDTKVHLSDPETLWERAMCISALCEKEGTDVRVYHKFNDPLDVQHTNYDWNHVKNDHFHNYWYPKQKNKCQSNLIVINSTKNNVMSLSDYGKGWKDPMEGAWEFVEDYVREDHEVVIVDYRTPIETLVELLGKAKGFIGYHGTAAWVAKFMHTPSFIYSQGGKLTSNSFPYARIGTFKSLYPMRDMFNGQDIQMIDFAEQYKTYYPPFHEQLLSTS